MIEGKSTPDQNTIEQVFHPLIGLPCWGAKWIICSIIALEFGIVAKPAIPSPVSLRRAAANPTANIPIRILPPGGEWNFALLNAAWTIEIKGETLDDVTFGDDEIKQALERLNGQTLSRADWTQDSHLILSFREGARINAGISPHHDADSDMWWLLQTHGVHVSFDGHGLLDIAYPKTTTTNTEVS